MGIGTIHRVAPTDSVESWVRIRCHASSMSLWSATTKGDRECERLLGLHRRPDDQFPSSRPVATRDLHVARSSRQAAVRDLCFVWEGTPESLKAALDRAGAKIFEGPVSRQGGRKKSASSLYVRDPDGNLLEFMIYP